MQTAVMTAIGPLFGLSWVQAARAGLLLAAGGEFAFVALCAPPAAAASCCASLSKQCVGC